MNKHSLHNGLVTVSVFVRDAKGEVEVKPTDVTNNIGRLKAGDEVTLLFEIGSSEHHVVPVTTNREKTVAKKLQVIPTRADGNRFMHRTTIRRDGTVDNNTNLVRFLVMTNKGEVSSHNVAVIGQKGEFYLAPAVTYRVQAYRNPNGSVAVPALFNEGDGKGSFVGVKPFVDAHYVPQFSLPAVVSYKKASLPPTDGLPDSNHLIVLSWSLANGTGVGLRNDGEQIKLHWSKVNVADRVPVYLQEFEILKVESYAPAPQGSSFEYEAQGMTRTEEMVEMVGV